MLAEDIITKRIATLHTYEILHTAPEQAYNHFAFLAAQLFEAKHACIFFMADDEIFKKAEYPTLQTNDLLKNLFIAAFNGEKTFILQKERVENMPSFFVAEPIKAPNGCILGMLAVWDEQVLNADPQKITCLQNLVALLMDKLETRKALRQTLYAQDDRLNVLIHDLKNPLTSMMLQSELLARLTSAEEKTTLIANKVYATAKRMLDHLNDILSPVKRANHSFKPQKTKINLLVLLKNTLKQLEKQLQNKLLNVKINSKNLPEIYADETRITAVFYQILHNAIKFSHPKGQIEINAETDETHVTIAIKDEGVGLSHDDLAQLFFKFAPLNSVATQQEDGNGLGLLLANMFVDMHKGKLWAFSSGTNQGCTIFTKLPIK